MNDRFKVVGLLGRQLARHRVPLPVLLRRAGLPPTFFQQEKIWVTTSELFSLWRAIGETSGDPGVGLKLGAEPRVELYNPTEIAAVCSRSFRDALQRMARYKQLTCPEEIRIHAAQGEVSVEFFYLQADEVQPDVLVDLCLSWILAVGRRGTGEPLTPVRVELVRPARNRELLERHFGCRVRFKAGRNALVFRAMDLDLPFVTYNKELLAAIGAQLESELLERTAGGDVREQVKNTLKRSLAGKRPTLQDVAQQLHLSVRTLQRRLTDADISFQQMLESTRRELAHHYLQQSAVELNETAYLLGYEDANSFFRAFHDWEGTSPGRWRARHRSADVSAAES